MYVRVCVCSFYVYGLSELYRSIDPVYPCSIRYACMHALLTSSSIPSESREIERGRKKRSIPYSGCISWDRPVDLLSGHRRNVFRQKNNKRMPSMFFVRLNIPSVSLEPRLLRNGMLIDLKREGEKHTQSRDTLAQLLVARKFKTNGADNYDGASSSHLRRITAIP